MKDCAVIRGVIPPWSAKLCHFPLHPIRSIPLLTLARWQQQEIPDLVSSGQEKVRIAALDLGPLNEGARALFYIKISSFKLQ